ncbi:hypothetical protein M408DRAFT_177178 [Serendipita vermifera MAFF 305830]|uniref:Uncharacterized protein n=1 Tax=Serendipita vermifera MAFF 305830 TaxID=933852 RepID=A0A0C3B3J6_SERVB|nr:hypothetical protein M408DRAFT_177178 [Serendipita vermifera MAFF 305830]
MDTLRGVVEASLTKIGKESAERLVPELCAIDIPSSTALTTLLLDPMNTVFKEHALLDVFTYFQQAKELNIAHVTGTHQREMETRLNKAELRHISRHCSTGFVLTQLSNGISITVMDGPSAAHCDEPQSSYEFIPLVGFATGNHEGPIKAAMDDLFLSRMNRGRSRSTICTLFLGHLLHLWREVITLWTVGEVVSTRVDVGPLQSRIPVAIDLI